MSARRTASTRDGSLYPLTGVGRLGVTIKSTAQGQNGKQNSLLE